MPRRKTFSPEERDERLAFALASGQWSNLACCRHAGVVLPHRQRAADYVASKLAEPGFRARIDAYSAMIAADEARLARGRDEAGALNRDWVLSRLKRIHAVAILDEPAAIAADGAEIYLPAPNLAAAIRALAEMARMLGARAEPGEDEDLDAVLAELRGGRAAPH